MKYEIIRLDGRYTYRDLFEYCIKFSNRMAVEHGPLNFNDAVKWFSETYGWSAEARQYDNMINWTTASQRVMSQFSSVRLSSGILPELPEHCNPHWSWTNGYDDLRIYVKSQQELTLFTLKYPVDQK